VLFGQQSYVYNCLESHSFQYHHKSVSEVIEKSISVFYVGIARLPCNPLTGVAKTQATHNVQALLQQLLLVALHRILEKPYKFRCISEQKETEQGKEEEYHVETSLPPTFDGEKLSTFCYARLIRVQMMRIIKKTQSKIFIGKIVLISVRTFSGLCPKGGFSVPRLSPLVPLLATPSCMSLW
jgi:hypothetical protein